MDRENFNHVGSKAENVAASLMDKSLSRETQFLLLILVIVLISVAILRCGVAFPPPEKNPETIPVSLVSGR